MQFTTTSDGGRSRFWPKRKTVQCILRLPIPEMVFPPTSCREFSNASIVSTRRDPASPAVPAWVCPLSNTRSKVRAGRSPYPAGLVSGRRLRFICLRERRLATKGTKSTKGNQICLIPFVLFVPFVTNLFSPEFAQQLRCEQPV